MLLNEVRNVKFLSRPGSMSLDFGTALLGIIDAKVSLLATFCLGLGVHGILTCAHKTFTLQPLLSQKGRFLYNLTLNVHT